MYHLALGIPNVSGEPVKQLYTAVACRGGQGGHGPRAQALEGAPAQLVGANFNLAKVAYMLWAPRSLCIRGSFLFLAEDFFLFFFLLVDFFPKGKC